MLLSRRESDIQARKGAAMNKRLRPDEAADALARIVAARSR